MKQATEKQMINLLMIVEMLKRREILFLPIPIVNDYDFKLGLKEFKERIDMIVKEEGYPNECPICNSPRFNCEHAEKDLTSFLNDDIVQSEDDSQ